MGAISTRAGATASEILTTQRPASKQRVAFLYTDPITQKAQTCVYAFCNGFRVKLFECHKQIITLAPSRITKLICLLRSQIDKVFANLTDSVQVASIFQYFKILGNLLQKPPRLFHPPQRLRTHSLPDCEFCNALPALAQRSTVEKAGNDCRLFH